MEHKPHTVLKYPKQEGLTKEYVINETRHFKYPKAWKYSQDKNNHYLKLYPHLIKKHYPDFLTRNYKPQIRERKTQRSIMDSVRFPRII